MKKVSPHLYELSSATEYEDALKSIQDDFGKIKNRLYETGLTRDNLLLFRGQEDSSWPIETTLERKVGTDIPVTEYLENAYRCAAKLTTFSGKTWDLGGYVEQCQMYDQIRELYLDQITLPSVEYLVYLRHHGFPSPLLDWTRSPMIALLFAYQNRTDAEQVAVNVFIERPEGVKMISGSMIRHVGPYMVSHQRHFLQQAEYTYAIKVDSMDRKVFGRHEDVICNGSGNQDVMVKILMPAADRLSVLKNLWRYNLHPYALFGSEDSLVQTLATEVFELDS